VKTILEIGNILPKQAEISFCISLQCITEGVKRYNKQKVFFTLQLWTNISRIIH
jgi:hypothetical protein